jgi:hypothetical protein
MKSLMLSAVAVLVSGAALAGPACNVPKEKWLPEAGFKKDLEAQGYQIKTYKAGKKVEIYFDPATGKPIESK